MTRTLIDRPTMGFLLLGLFLSTGCNLLEIFKDDKKDIKRQIERMKRGVNTNDWKLIDSLMTKEFEWRSSDKITYDTRVRNGKKIEFGKKYFRESIDRLPQNRMAFYMRIKKMEKINKSRYVAVVESRLAIRKYAASTDNIMWTSNQTWIKFGNRWKVTSIKDITQKVGSRNVLYPTNPIRKKKPVKKK